MAKKTGSEDDGNQMIANVGARRDRMKNGFERLYRLECEKKDLEEEHLSEVKDEIKKERKNISADCDVEAADWKIMYAAYKREQEAKKCENEEDRIRIFDNLKFGFSVLAKGEMVNFLDVMEQSEAA